MMSAHAIYENVARQGFAIVEGLLDNNTITHLLEAIEQQKRLKGLGNGA